LAFFNVCKALLWQEAEAQLAVPVITKFKENRVCFKTKDMEYKHLV